MTETTFAVVDRPDESRYVLVDQSSDGREAGEESYVDVDAAGTVERVLFHTGVDEAYGGQGLASFLVQHVVADVVARGYAIVPVCPYVAKWLTRHPEYDAHVVKPTPTHLRAVNARQQ
ncbi:N-acetyltransferase [Gordonia alkaliphila]|uniref:GNAT family N-acetyltransferase n=1 Tax=Gordonia alkaliphila TaxID=1053547 RepID=UPI001FF4FDBC|nr:GNAT family N-acetyltransferase [Gordonia alkaliphila]MCK0438183.1 N-acetyltransferase [Gordonia alkaliphila]